MASLDTLTPAAATIVKLFAYPFRSAPTADIVAWGVDLTSRPGGSPAALLDLLFDYPVAGSPFTSYARISTNTAFATALVDNLALGTSVASAVKAGWVDILLAELPLYASRGAMTWAVVQFLEAGAFSDVNLQALRTSLLGRTEAAAAFAQSAAGAVWDRQGFAQLLEPLEPQPSYALSASTANVSEGSSITFTLQTTHVAAGTSLPYVASGIGSADLASGTLAGNLTVGADGSATVTLALAADATTEGTETLRVVVGDGLASAEASVIDSSTTPQPTYAIQADSSTVNEGASVTYTLTTTRVPAGTQIAYTLSGTGITTADLNSGTLSGLFTIDGDGVDILTLGMAADALTEGTETLKLSLAANRGQVDVSILDTSTTPPPGAPDVVIVADDMENPFAEPPPNAADGELRIDTYLSYDLLNQASSIVSRLSIATLRSSGSAGQALITTNQRADRGNVPQVSNQELYTFDLGSEVDLVDYSAEAGEIVLVATRSFGAATQYVLLNDDDDDDDFDDATDRRDTLIDVEEVVASKGGGILDLTASGRDWEIRFSHDFDAGDDVVAAKDRAVHRLRLEDDDTGEVYPRSLLEYRDAGDSAGVTQDSALWSEVQGSDRDEKLVYAAVQAAEARSDVLRGGDNEVDYIALGRSLIAEVEIERWITSTSLADDTNDSGVTTVTITHTTGDGLTPLSTNRHVISAHTPDNRVSAGELEITATQDDEDSLSFAAVTEPKVFVIGSQAGGSDGGTVRLAGVHDSEALSFWRFETLRDTGSDDLYIVERIVRATQGDLVLSDSGSADHDAVRIADEALGSAAVGGAVGTVRLATLNGAAPGFAFDFDVLDLSGVVDEDGLDVIGTAGTDDELVVGRLDTLDDVDLFESLVLTDASVDRGTALTLDLDLGRVKAGNTNLFDYDGEVISGGGLLWNASGQAGAIEPMSIGMTITVIDDSAGSGATLWGGSAADTFTGDEGDDILRGGGGNDKLTGGLGVDTFVFESTGEANGRDEIEEFEAGSDELDVSAFTGVSINAAAPSLDGALGGELLGAPAKAEFIYNKANGRLDEDDFADSSEAGKFEIPDGGASVVVVTADPTGAAGNAENSAMSVYFVVNGAASGLSDLSVTLVATVTADDELTLAQMFDALH